MLLNSFFLVLFMLIMTPAVVLLLGVTRWQSATVALGDRLEAQRRQITPRTYEPQELEGLPPPVQAYFQAVLAPGQPIIAAAEIGQEGQIDLGRAKARWVEFRARQSVFTERPGFAWDARVRWLPGLGAYVHDALVSGQGIVRAMLFGLIPVAKTVTSAQLGTSELIRFLAEAVWYPTKLLPSQGVRWEAIDDETAQATLTDGETTVSVQFSFDEAGMVREVRAEDRFRMVKGQMVPTPWEGRFLEYREHGGMLVPVQGEAAWLLPEGRRPYWKGRVSEIMYKFTP